MPESNSAQTQIDSTVNAYYKALQKHIDSLTQKVQEKSVIQRNSYNDIAKCLLKPKGKPFGLFSSQFSSWAKKHFVLITIAGVDIVVVINPKNLYVFMKNIIMLLIKHIPMFLMVVVMEQSTNLIFIILGYQDLLLKYL